MRPFLVRIDLASSAAFVSFSRGAVKRREVKQNNRRNWREREKLTARHDLPMIEHRLGEGLALCVTPEIGGEAEGLHDGQVRLDGEHGGSGPLLLAEDLSTTLVEHTVDTTNSVLRALDLD